jgi:glycerol-3-phosphate acyltransferase PlsY
LGQSARFHLIPFFKGIAREAQMICQGVFFGLTAYLLGSVPFGKLLSSKVAHVDITQRGSRNIGATNVARELGMKWGVLTLVLDLLKGFVPVLVFAFLLPEGALHREIYLAGIGLLALLGHQFSIFLKFRGGKGVSTALGVYLALSPLSCLAALLVFLLVFRLWDMVSLGSLIWSAVMPLFIFLFGESLPMICGSLIAAALIWFKHRDNIQRLIKGEERKWKDRASQPSRSRSRSNSSSE